MEFLAFYALFAVATAIHGLVEILAPVFISRDVKGLEVHRKYLIYMVFFGTSLLIAPVIFLACMVPTVGESFRIHLEEGLFTEA